MALCQFPNYVYLGMLNKHWTEREQELFPPPIWISIDVFNIIFQQLDQKSLKHVKKYKLFSEQQFFEHLHFCLMLLVLL